MYVYIRHMYMYADYCAYICVRVYDTHVCMHACMHVCMCISVSMYVSIRETIGADEQTIQIYTISNLHMANLGWSHWNRAQLAAAKRPRFEYGGLNH